MSEENVGIVLFRTKGEPIKSFVKHRISDFLVEEIDTDQ